MKELQDQLEAEQYFSVSLFFFITDVKRQKDVTVLPRSDFLTFLFFFLCN